MAAHFLSRLPRHAFNFFLNDWRFNVSDDTMSFLFYKHFLTIKFYSANFAYWNTVAASPLPCSGAAESKLGRNDSENGWR